ncbi:hypothetical protein BpHYR1_047392 [Brachionus plicatilis]|uniref:Uncharacterized protein n=1 Tax=Brachionus plicatilis TaxID=10195 RepID=A0A3M7T5Y8_BRAPC|nr:hypothetical protein BpHYR1_047392 [Brachionus plicatilis]
MTFKSQINPTKKKFAASYVINIKLVLISKYFKIETSKISLLFLLLFTNFYIKMENNKKFKKLSFFLAFSFLLIFTNPLDKSALYH